MNCNHIGYQYIGEELSVVNSRKILLLYILTNHQRVLRTTANMDITLTVMILQLVFCMVGNIIKITDIIRKSINYNFNHDVEKLICSYLYILLNRPVLPNCEMEDTDNFLL